VQSITKVRVHIAPALTCLIVGLALALTPLLVWRVRTGAWVCLHYTDPLYYLTIAARAYYNHPLFLSDPEVPGGPTFYPWLQFVPALLVIRSFGLSVISLNIVWDIWAGMSLSLGFYLLFWCLLKDRWIATGCALFSLANAIELSSRYLKLIVSPSASRMDMSALMQWRTPDPALDLPFIVVQIVALAVARERRSVVATAVAGLLFGMLFYVYFFAWTLAAVALCLALLLDASARKVYAATLGIGLCFGLPQLVHDSRVARLASPEALTRFWFLAPYPRSEGLWLPYTWIPIVAVLGYWMWREKHSDLIYLWSFAAGGILLGRERLLSGIYLHEYHWDWLWPILATAVLLVAGTRVGGKYIRGRRIMIVMVSAALLVYVLSAVHLASVFAQMNWTTGVPRDFLNYRQQRMRTAVTTLAPGSLIAGDEVFCDLMTVVENQRALADPYLASSLALDDAAWEAREALNAVLQGTQAPEFREQARELTQGLWSMQKQRDAALVELLGLYDRFSRDPSASADSFGVRYVSIAVGPQVPAYLARGWTMLQPGPFWQVWERKKKE
jgi:hypothetical protein